MAAHPDIQAEQAHIDKAYERLEATREAARRLMTSVLDQGRGGTFQAREERDVIVRTSLHRLEQLDIGDRPLVFGRIDLAGPRQPGGVGGGPSYHIGRLAVSGDDLDPLVVDWRAPVAEPFYRATYRDPMGLIRRRHFATEGRRLVGIEDEVFRLPEVAAEESPQAAGEREAAGDETAVAPTEENGHVPSGALLAAMERSRSGHLRDIVATIQREQDEVIRAPLPGLLVVQGGPGTGKTVVALHRAAYLLYTHRFPLEGQGVLMVGPNQLYLRYIEQVLPSLGESGVTSVTVEGLYPDARARAEEPRALARLKGEARMARLVAAAVRSRQRPLRDDLVVPWGARVLRLPQSDLAAIVRTAKRRPGSHNARRRLVESLVAEQLARELARLTGDAEEGDPESEQDLIGDLRRAPRVVQALDRMWPRLQPEELLHDLYGAPPLLAAAGRGLLDPEERAALHRARSASLAEIPWTRADIPLLDEARVLLGPRVRRSDDGPRNYGHILVDEAQDLSPMQLRMLARRSLSGSMTVVGDIAQATGPHAADDWNQITSILAPGRPVRRAELTVNYRTPAEIVELASRVLAAAAPDLAPPRSIRTTGVQPEITPADSDSLLTTATDSVRTELAAVDPGTVAVIAPASLVPALAAALSGAGLPARVAADRLEAPITVVAVEAVKGLEFDAVVVVEPALIVEETGSQRSLYVALTRPTQRLAVVHAQPLPASLATARA